MIEVIERGPEKFITTCQKCGTKFSYQLEDLASHYGYNPYVYCPVCKESCYHHLPKEHNISGEKEYCMSSLMTKEELEEKYKKLVSNTNIVPRDPLRDEFPSFYR